MARENDDEQRLPPKPKHAVGDLLDSLSIDELRLRIDVLREEITRLEAEIASKQASRGAADAFFRR